MLKKRLEARRKALEDLLSVDGGPVGSPEELKEDLLKAMDEDLEKSLRIG